MIRGIYNRIMKRSLGINYQIKRGGARAQHIDADLRKQFSVIIDVREYSRGRAIRLFTRVFPLTILQTFYTQKRERNYRNIHKRSKAKDKKKGTI